MSRHMPTRRAFLVASLLAAATARAAPHDDAARALERLERRHGGRLGVTIVDTASGRRIAHRADERFAMCSTFKLVAVAHVLSRVDRGDEELARPVVFGPEALAPYSPVTGPHAGVDAMTIASLCDAAITMSDNTAANLLLDGVGGPPSLTAWLRTIGDRSTRLDRREPELNQATPGDPRDTTTPRAMAGTLHALLVGSVLSTGSRDRLVGWLVANKTGDRRLRAGLPVDWRIGDKTGTGGHRSTNDIAILWPPGRAPLIVTAYHDRSRGSSDQREAVLADVGRLVATS